MHLKTTPFTRSLAALLVEVPGWPDAPLGPRLRRLVPIALPLFLLSGMLLWVYLAIEPQRERAAREATALLALEAEIAELALRTSEAEAVRLRGEAKLAQEWLIASEEERTTLFTSLQAYAAEAGWSAKLSGGEILASSASAGEAFTRSSGRGLLTPFPDNARPLATLVPLLERFSNATKRIDLIRLAIRADEQGWHTVELGFYAAHLPPHEKMAQ